MWLTIYLIDQRVQPVDERVTTVYVASPACYPGRSTFKLIWPDSFDISAELRGEIEEHVQAFIAERAAEVGNITARAEVDIVLHHASCPVASPVHGASDSGAGHNTNAGDAAQ